MLKEKIITNAVALLIRAHFADGQTLSQVVDWLLGPDDLADDLQDGHYGAVMDLINEVRADLGRR